MGELLPKSERASQDLSHEWRENEKWDGQKDYGRVSSNVGIVLDHNGEERAEPEALDLPVGLHSSPLLWSWALSTVRMNDNGDATAKICSSLMVAGFSLRDSEKNTDIQRELGVESFLFHSQEESAEVVQASDYYAYLVLSFGGFLDMSNRKETPG